MPGGWIVELRGRRPCQTLVLCERFAVAIEEQAAAVSAVVPFSEDMLDVRITAEASISESALKDLRIAPGGVRRH